MSYGRAGGGSDWRASSLLNPGPQEGAGFKSFAEDMGSLSRGGADRPSGSISDVRILALERAVDHLEKDNELVKNAVAILEGDRDNLRQAIRKLKVENGRMKIKCKRMAMAIKGEAAADDMDLGLDDEDVDFADIKDFILIGGPKDPFSLRFEATIKDDKGLEHKSAERYLWYKMAETFDDMEAAEKIRTAANGAKAEEEMGKIKGFDETAWNKVKMRHWEDGQRFKVEQVKWIQNLLVYSGNQYLAIASQDKTWGTGWRKQRQESAQPRMWDGENKGGRVLMKLRTELKEGHSYDGSEEQETKDKFNELKRTFWRREKRMNEDDMMGGGGRGGGFGMRGGGGRGGGMGYGGGRGNIGGGRGGGDGFQNKRPRGRGNYQY